MNVLPNHTGDRHRAHEAHDHNALAFHEEENAERPTSNVQHRKKRIRRWALGVGRWALRRITYGIVSPQPPDFRLRPYSALRFSLLLRRQQSRSSRRW